MLLDHACKQAVTRSRAVGRLGANGSGMIDRPANWMIDDSSSSVAVQLLAKDASFAREHPVTLARCKCICTNLRCAYVCVYVSVHVYELDVAREEGLTLHLSKQAWVNFL